MTTSRALVLRPPAKINLTLRVGARRADGFHDVRTVLQSIGVSDTLVAVPTRGRFVLTSTASGVPADQTNLVWRAAEMLWRALGRAGDPQGAHLTLEKAIPVAAGLGGGSADAAAALVALNRLWGARQSRSALAQLAATLGADVPFFLLGGTALGAGRGDEMYPLSDVKRVGVVVITPAFGVATADAYQWLDEDRARDVPAPGSAVSTVDLGWPTGPTALVNDLEAPVARRQPAIAEMIAACVRAGAMGGAMTGSGSAVFGLFSEATAPRAARRLQRPEWRVLVTRTLTRREAARRIGL